MTRADTSGMSRHAIVSTLCLVVLTASPTHALAGSTADPDDTRGGMDLREAAAGIIDPTCWGVPDGYRFCLSGFGIMKHAFNRGGRVLVRLDSREITRPTS